MRTITVDGYVATAHDHTDLREEIWAFALDQRAFGPRRFVVAFADPANRFLALAHTARTDPPEDALDPCIRHVGRGAAVAVVLCDEPVRDGPPPPWLAGRLERARRIASGHGIHLVDWISCDDQLFRSAALALEPADRWWRLPD